MLMQRELDMSFEDAKALLSRGAKLGFLEVKGGRSVRTQGCCAECRLRMETAMVTRADSRRDPVPAALRFAVLQRDAFRCRYCGATASDGVKLHIDHIVPVVAGGETSIDNLVAACEQCNLGKAAHDVV